MSGDSPNTDRCLIEYQAVHERISALVLDSDPRLGVPACPGWYVRDVVAHLAGLCEDWVNQRLDNYASDSWTSGQIDRFAQRSFPAILEAWAVALVRFAQIETDFHGLPPARWAFGDAVIHEGDIRGALGASRVPENAVHLGMRGTLARWEREVLTPAGLPTLQIRTPEGGLWTLGSKPGSKTVALEVPTYDLFRALAGRRSPEQVRQWDWSADPSPYIQVGLPYPFQWASSALTD